MSDLIRVRGLTRAQMERIEKQNLSAGTYLVDAGATYIDGTMEQLCELAHGFNHHRRVDSHWQSSRLLDADGQIGRWVDGPQDRTIKLLHEKIQAAIDRKWKRNRGWGINGPVDRK